MAIRTGLIGFGLAGGAFHAPLIAATPALELVAVASTRGAAVRARLPGAQLFATPEALIAEGGVDLVVIATPNALHAPLARAALNAGKHVVVDKPFVADPDDGAPLIALAREQGRLLVPFHNRRWDADFLTVDMLVGDGTLGAVMLAELNWDRLRPAIKPGWREEPGPGAGLLADLGPHLADQVLQLFGPPDHVTGDLAVQRADALVDDHFTVTLHHGPARIVLSASTLVAAPRPRFALHGTRGSFVKHGIDRQEAVLRAGGMPGEPGYGEEPPELHGRLTLTDGTTRTVPSARGDWRRFYAGTAAAIATGAPPPVEADDALTGLRLLDLARRSAAEGRTLPFLNRDQAAPHQPRRRPSHGRASPSATSVSPSDTPLRSTIRSLRP